MNGATCHACAQPVTEGHRFCGHCGAALAEDAPVDRGEHRPVTVLFCDLVDSTGIAERLGDEALHRTLDRFFAIAVDEVERYGGTVDKFLGDGILALIGAPQAYEDHARRAVLASLGLRQRLHDAWPVDEMGPPPLARMGIDSGVLVVGTLGVGRRVDHTAIGDTANVAARLQAAAEPGEILISERTAQRVAGYARLAPRGRLALRGRTEPVVAHRLVGVGSRRSPLEGVTDRGLTPFVGRADELDVLRDAVGAIQECKGRVVSIGGAPGLGKSRLVLEFRRALGAEPVTFLEGRCLSFGAATPYLPLADIVRANAGITPDDPPEALAGKVDLALSEIGVDSNRSALFLLHLLGVPAGDPIPRLSPEAVRDNVFATLREMCLEGSRRRPLVLAVEDLHWIDATSEAFLRSLAEILLDARILLLATHRPEYRPPWADLAWSSSVTLGPLGTAESRRVVRAVIGPATADTPLEGAILGRADGNPFFLEELARVAGDVANPWDPAEVPDTVQGVLMARMDRLDPEAKRTLQTASVLGREFSARLLGSVWRGRGELDHHLAKLRRLEFVFERPTVAGRRWAFTHALTQDVAYGSLLSDRRRELHRAAAESLRSMPDEQPEGVEELLALHCSRAEMHDEAVRHLRAVAERSAGRYAHDEATQALELALRHVERLPRDVRDGQSVELSLRLAESLYFLGQVRSSAGLLARLEEGARRRGDRNQLAELRFWIAHAHSHLGDPDEAAAAARDSAELAERAGETAVLGRARYVLAREGWWTGRWRTGISEGEAAVPILEEAGQAWWLGHCLCYVGHGYQSLGQFDRALAAVSRAQEIGEATGDPRIRSFAAWSRGWYLASMGRPEEGIPACEEAVAVSPDAANSAWALGFLGFAHRESGDTPRAIDELERALDVVRQTEHPRVLCWFQGWLADAHLAAGRPHPARAAARSALTIAGRVQCPWAAAYATRSLGRIALLEGDTSEAARHLGAAITAYHRLSADFEQALTLLDAARWHRRLGDHESATARARDASRLLAPMPVPLWQQRAAQEAEPAPA